MSIQINVKKTNNPIRELNGVGNGPVNGNFLRDRTKEFKEAGISYSRTHDTEGFYGSGEFINIHCIFPDFRADVNDPESYNFACTDIYLKNIINAGTKVYYRLGESIENRSHIVARHIHPPKDPKKWAEICEHIIMHYNEGWADGYHMGIEYWEIWNEPDNWHLWTGTPEQYYELYSVTANHLKSRFPNLKIGGYGSTGFYTAVREDYTLGAFDDWFVDLIPFGKGFLKYISAPETKAPLDFFSWHFYSNAVEDIAIIQGYIRNLLDEHGFNDTETHLNEWNYNDLIHGGNTTMEFRQSMPCAAFVAAMFVAMHDSGVDKAMYYDADVSSYCGLWEWKEPEPKKPYYAFVAYKALIDLGFDAGCVVDNEKRIYSLAASDGTKSAVMIVNTGETTEDVVIDFENKAENIEIYILSEDKNLEKSGDFESASNVKIICEPDTVVLVKVK